MSARKRKDVTQSVIESARALVAALERLRLSVGPPPETTFLAQRAALGRARKVSR